MGKRKEFEIAFKLLAEYGGGFTTTLSGASKEIKGLSEQIKAAGTVSKNIEGYKKTQEAFEESQKKAKKLSSELEALQEKYTSTGEKSETLEKKIESKRAALEKASEAVSNQKAKLSELSGKLEDAGVDTGHLTEAQEEYSKKLDGLKSQKSNIEELTVKQAQYTEEVKSSAKELGVLAGAYAGMLAGAYKLAAEPAIEFESAFVGVEKTVDGTKEQLAEMREEIIDMSTDGKPATAEEIAAVAESAGQLGIARQDIMDFSSVMIDLGESTNLTSEEAASSLAKYANITKMSADNYDELGSVIVALGNNFATTEADIVNMATNMASAGTVTGMSQSQIMALSTALSSVGIEAEAGGTAASKLAKEMNLAVETYDSANAVISKTGYSVRELEMMQSHEGKAFGALAEGMGYTKAELSGFLDKAKGMEQFSSVAGITAEEFKKLYGEDSLKAMAAFISGLNDTERNGKSAVEILDGMGLTEVRLSNAILSLASSGDLLTNAVDLSNTAWEENTALSEEAGKRYDTTESKIQMVKNALTAAQIELGDMMLPTISKLATEGVKLLKEFKEWCSENEDLIKTLAGVAVKGGALLIGVKALQTAAPTAKLGMTALKKVTATFGVSALSAGGGAKTAAAGISIIGKSSLLAAGGVALVGAALLGAMYIADETRKAWLEANREISDTLLFDNGGEKIEDFTASLKNGYDDTLDFAKGVNDSAEAMEELDGNVANARDEVAKYFGVLDDGITAEDAEKLKEPFNELCNYLEQDFKKRYSDVISAFNQALTEAAGSVGINANKVSETLESFKEKYLTNVEKSQQTVNDYNDRMAKGEKLSKSEQSEYRNEVDYLYDLSAQDSDSLSGFKNGVAGFDFGADSETATKNLTEITEYAKEYLQEMQEMQKNNNSNFDDARYAAKVNYEHGKISESDYTSTVVNINTAQGLASEVFEEKYNGFKDEIAEFIETADSQLTDAESKIAAEEVKNMSGWEKFTMGLQVLAGQTNKFITGVSDGKGFEEDFDDIAHERAFEAAEGMYSELEEQIGLLKEEVKNSDPIIIPAEVSLDYKKAQNDYNLEQANSQISEINANPFGGRAAVMSADEVKSIVAQTKAANEEQSKYGKSYAEYKASGKSVYMGYASGTNYSVDTFIAGEEGPELITNARGRKIFTATETADILGGGASTFAPVINVEVIGNADAGQIKDLLSREMERLYREFRRRLRDESNNEARRAY